ncbi:hypothetical protein U1Q18_032915 [Sarracenia purpurea var. burkii]
MSIPPESAGEEEEEEHLEEQGNQELSHHPTAPSDKWVPPEFHSLRGPHTHAPRQGILINDVLALTPVPTSVNRLTLIYRPFFDLSTTVDPGYIISLIRKLLPPDGRNRNRSSGVDASTPGSTADGRKESVVLLSQNSVLNECSSEMEVMDTIELIANDGGDNRSCEKQYSLDGDDAWEEYGCILWDLAASKTHAEFMVQNLILEVLLANLMIPQSVRVREIMLGIIGNLACHEVSRKHIASTNGLIEVIVDQLFSDDTPCLCEVFR